MQKMQKRFQLILPLIQWLQNLKNQMMESMVRHVQLLEIPLQTV